MSRAITGATLTAFNDQNVVDICLDLGVQKTLTFQLEDGSGTTTNPAGRPVDLSNYSITAELVEGFNPGNGAKPRRVRRDEDGNIVAPLTLATRMTPGVTAMNSVDVHFPGSIVTGSQPVDRMDTLTLEFDGGLGIGMPNSPQVPINFHNAAIELGNNPAAPVSTTNPWTIPAGTTFTAEAVNVNPPVTETFTITNEMTITSSSFAIPAGDYSISPTQSTFVPDGTRVSFTRTVEISAGTTAWQRLPTVGRPVWGFFTVTATEMGTTGFEQEFTIAKGAVQIRYIV